MQHYFALFYKCVSYRPIRFLLICINRAYAVFTPYIMPASCAVAFCKNTARQGRKAHFFRFPKDRTLQNAWIQRCSRKHKFNIKTSRMCSEHFADSDIENFMEYKLMGNVKPYLKKDAVPSKNLKPLTVGHREAASVKNKRITRYQKKQNLLKFNKLVIKTEEGMASANISTECSTINHSPKVRVYELILLIGILYCRLLIIIYNLLFQYVVYLHAYIQVFISLYKVSCIPVPNTIWCQNIELGIQIQVACLR